MEIQDIMLIILWSVLLTTGAFCFMYKVILPTYKMTILESDFQELLIALNAAIQTELDLWDKDVFVNKKALTNSNFDNFYLEITEHIIASLSPIFYINMGKYLTEEAVVSIIGRKTKEYLVTKTNS